MSSSGASQGITDLHSHLVPGVDDGASTIEDTMEGIGRMVARGVRTIVTTPHVRGSLAHQPEALQDRLGELREAFEQTLPAVMEAWPELDFRLGCEIMLDRPDLDLSHPGLGLGGASVLLVEWPGLQVPPETPAVLESLRGQGLQVMIAHPERYQGFQPGLAVVPRWREEGAFLQMNHGSLLGRFGPEIRERAFRFLAHGWVDCLSSDFHGRPTLRLYMTEARAVFEDVGAVDTWTLLTETNPARILAGDPPLPVPPLAVGRGFMRRLLARIRP